jgi:uncharacterized protein (DUF2126 family)
LSRGLDTPAGNVLPLARDWDGDCWESAPWEFRRGRLSLIPGDSLLGLRLPLERLPQLAEDEQEIEVEADPFAPQQPSADFQGIEPWLVLGEETTNLGTARFVGSSVERLQATVTGLTDGRYYEHFAVNPYEAEARRHIRLNQWGHTPGSVTPPLRVDTLPRFVPEGHGVGPMAPPPEEPPAELPDTLDLRRPPGRGCSGPNAPGG